MELRVVQHTGCGTLDLPGTRLVRGLGGGKAAAQNRRQSLAVEFLLRSNYVRLRAKHVWDLELANCSLQLWKVRHRPRKSHPGGSRFPRWRAGGIQLPPFASELWDGVKNPLLRSFQDRNNIAINQSDTIPNGEAEAEAETKAYFLQERTIDAKFLERELSTAAIDCIEQFSRLNGLTGKKMRLNFESSTPLPAQSQAQNLVEFACFRYLARCNVDFHPSLKDTAFRRLTFSAMLAWQRPYKDHIPNDRMTANGGLPRIGFVGEQAFTRIAPAIAGAADHAVAHYLYHALVGQNEGLTFDVWDRYCSELCKIQKGRDQQLDHEGAKLGLEAGECIICVGSDTTQPVQKWNKDVAWPGRLTLTERALYFEANGLTHHKKATRLDLTGSKASVEKKKVGPFGLEVFDSAICVSSNPEQEPWILEFVDFSGEGRRNIWLLVMKEIFAVHAFITEFGVEKHDPLVNYVYGAKNGKKKVLSAAVMGIARLQAVHAILGKLPAHAERLLQFSYLANVPSGELVRQALAVCFWGGRMEVQSRDIEYLAMGGGDIGTGENAGSGPHLVGTDGMVYLRNWATSPSWNTGKSSVFWKARSGNKGLVLGKYHVVGGLTQVERAVRACRDQVHLAEKTQATIDGALLTGIPNNVDLLQELLLPFSIIATNLGKLKRWENPGASVAFLFVVYGIIYMNWLAYVLPAVLLSGAACILTLRVLNTRGCLGENFGRVTIREQPPTNTIQKILALKEALSALEDFLQSSNIALLKLRTVALSREPRVTNEVLMALVGLGVAMLVVPFRYLLAVFIADQFTNELKFREKSVQELYTYLRNWWSTLPAAPVAVLPPDKHNEGDSKTDEGSPSKAEAVMQAMSEWLGEDSQISQLTGGTN